MDSKLMQSNITLLFQILFRETKKIKYIYYVAHCVDESTFSITKRVDIVVRILQVMTSTTQTIDFFVRQLRIGRQETTARLSVSS